MNPRLRTIIADAKAVNMPADNIKRAIQRGTGELPGVSYEEITYEGYGPGGVAIMIEVLTDNKNRTVGEMRHTLGKHGGNLGEANSVAWMFEKKGYIVVEKTKPRGLMMKRSCSARPSTPARTTWETTATTGRSCRRPRCTSRCSTP